MLINGFFGFYAITIIRYLEISGAKAHGSAMHKRHVRLQSYENILSFATSFAKEIHQI